MFASGLIWDGTRCHPSTSTLLCTQFQRDAEEALRSRATHGAQRAHAPSEMVYLPVVAVEAGEENSESLLRLGCRCDLARSTELDCGPESEQE